MSIYLTVEAVPGDRLKATCAQVCALADRIGIAVNGTSSGTYQSFEDDGPDVSADQQAEAWAMERAAEKKRLRELPFEAMRVGTPHVYHKER